MSELAELLGITEFEAQALIARVENGDLTDDDWVKIGEAIPRLIESFGNVLSDLLGIVPTEPTWRTTPRPDVELGGTPRNPEADVLDDIDRLVTWQLEKGEGW